MINATKQATTTPSRMSLSLPCRLMILLVLVVALPTSIVGANEAECNDCHAKHVSLGSQRQYTVGVLAVAGIANTYERHGLVFSNYLTATAGQRFDPPLSFTMQPLNFENMFDLKHDFHYVNPSAATCLEAEYRTESVVSHIAKSEVGDQVHDLSQFGGVIVARADNDNINTIQDLRNKVIAAASISAFGAGQMQFLEMQNAGMSYANDPKQLVFTSDQARIINGVLKGEFDVGFVRTNQMERTVDPLTGDLIDVSLLKIIEPRVNRYRDNGSVRRFPFTSSTPLYPEWNLAVLNTVPTIVTQEVQAAMLALEEHARLGYTLQACKDADPSADCTDLSASTRCDSTHDIAMTAMQAMRNGDYAGFRTSFSYAPVRAMLQDIGFLTKNQEHVWQCPRPSQLYESISCPVGYFRKTREEVEEGCEAANLKCGFGYTCICNPCAAAFDVDVAPVSTRNRNPAGCSKMSVCGTTQQTVPIKLRALDNKNRTNVDMAVVVHEGRNQRQINISKDDQTGNLHEFSVVSNYVGSLILEIFLDGEQISESPLRVQIIDRDCSIEYGERRRANREGGCECDASTIKLFGTCVLYSVLIPSLVCPIAVAIILIVCMYIEKKRHEADSVWAVKPEELIFAEPPTVIGQGTFGFVLLAEYRGTQVAVKRVLTPDSSEIGTSNGSAAGTSHRGDENATASSDEAAPVPVTKLKSGMFHSTCGMSSNAMIEQLAGPGKSFDSVLPVGTMSIDESLPADLEKDRDIEANYIDSIRPKNRSAMKSGNFNKASGMAGGANWKTNPRSATASVGASSSGMVSAPSLGTISSKSANKRGGSSDGISSMNGRRSGRSPIVGHQSKAASSKYPSGLDSKLVVAHKGSSHLNNSKRGSRTAASSQPRSLFDIFGRKKGSHGNSYSKQKEEFVQEMRLLSKLRHPCITTVMGAVVAKGQEPALVMEYMNHGSLYDLLHNETMVMEGELILNFLRDIASGVRFLHSADPQVVHGDLKSANVLVDSKFRAKVADFGFSHRKNKGAMGTPFFMAPELLRGETSNTAASDMYSLGVILYELYSRKDPYEGENAMEVLRLVCDHKVNKRPAVPRSCPPKVSKLMKFLLVGDPSLRPTASEFDNRLKELTSETVQPNQGPTVPSFSGDKHNTAARGKNSRGILAQMFPPHIAELLERGGQPEVETHELITIFFSDIVGFTSIASKSSPIKVSQMLSRLYVAFDELAQEHDLFKIETIGDAYMCASNLAKDQSKDHVVRIAKFAADAVKVAGRIPIDEDDLNKGYIQIRCGFHSGPVVSNVIGSLNPRYGVFGDTVNVASRMESTSDNGRVQCSERSALLLMGQDSSIAVKLRGDVPVKGRGLMTTYWVH